ncbi:MAG: hypothetical protein WA071_01000 [Undibacterium umbellatum]|uniref:hypothetical protein n=1 Tax=Undibacterium umbellatum TaxID=2762300 RepID=UPI003BB73794
MFTEIYVENASAVSSEEQILFVLQCQMGKGEAIAGANICVPFNSEFDMRIPIDEVEVVDRECVKIKVNCTDADELEFLLGLKLSGEILTIE